MEDERALDIRVAEVHVRIDIAGAAVLVLVWNDEAVLPMRLRRLNTVDVLHHEMDLVNMEVMNFIGGVHDAPYLGRADLHGDDWFGVRTQAQAVNDVLLLLESD